MDGLGSLLGIVSVLIPQLPVFAVWIVGIVIAATRLKQHRRVSQLAILIFCLLLIEAVIGTVTTVLLPLYATGRGSDSIRLSTIFGVIGIVRGFFHAVVWGLIVWLIFGWRRAPLAPSNV